MKRLLSLTVALVLGLVVAGCSKAESSAADQKKNTPNYGPGTLDHHRSTDHGPRR
jgi:hypothetical protein